MCSKSIFTGFMYLSQMSFWCHWLPAGIQIHEIFLDVGGLHRERQKNRVSKKDKHNVKEEGGEESTLRLIDRNSLTQQVKLDRIGTSCSLSPFTFLIKDN